MAEANTIFKTNGKALARKVVNRRRHTWGLYLNGKTVSQIAEEFKVSAPTIVEDIRAMGSALEEHDKAILDGALKERTLALARWSNAYTKAMDEWERSRADVTVVTEDGKKVKKQRLGNPAFLRTAMDALERIDVICGTSKPADNNFNTTNIINLPPDFWSQLAARRGEDAVEARIGQVALPASKQEEQQT